MKVSVKFTPAMVASDADLRRITVVVIDVLRATSTIAKALESGAREVIPAATIEEAVGISHRLGTDRTLLGGERDGMKINGFHLSNSPLEYTPEVVHGKTIVLTTTNGSGALLRARNAERCYCGALINAGAIARRLASDRPEEVMIVCAGTYGDFSQEDALAAGAIVSELISFDAEMNPGADALRFSDGARASVTLFDHYRDRISESFATSDHGRMLIGLGYGADLAFCSQLNIADAPVPIVVGSSIKLYQEQSDKKPVARFL
jgi:2-phosphosulfolactate phosphatase